MTRLRSIGIDRAILDPHLLGKALGQDLTSWAPWISVLRAAFALPMTPEDAEFFKKVSGGREPPTKRVNQFWAVLGRRSGKTRMAAAISVYIATLQNHKLAPGEVGHVLLIAASKDQAQVAFSYVVGFLETSPILKQQIEGMTASEVRLAGNIVIGVHAGSFRTIRGRTLLAVVGDETSFWRDETSSQADVEIFRACAPALAASGGMWIGISTGYRKLGLLYQRWKDFYGVNNDETLVIQGATADFNLTIDPAIIAQAAAADPEAEDSEWRGGFRSDIAAFLDDAVIDACTDHARPLEIPPRRGINYCCGIDPSGGRADHMTMCIGHTEGTGNSTFFVADVIRGREPPFDPNACVAEFAQLCKEYNISKVTGDNYSAAWCQTAFERAGIRYERSEMPKSQLYLESLPNWMRRTISIPDHPRLLRELRLLERRTSRSGKDSVDHGQRGHDDYANALVVCMRHLVSSSYNIDGFLTDNPEDVDGAAAYRMANFRNHIYRTA